MRQGEIIGLKYRILKPIGQGGNSTVFLGENIILSNLWAIKAIGKDSPSAMVEMHEISILKSLNHPMLPRIADLCEDEKHIYIVMDYIEGETLAEVLKEEGRIRESRLLDWARQLCDVLAYLHSRKPPVIYRDLKPSNIILGEHGRLHLVDFGTAKSYKEQTLEDTVYIGTQGYAAPEQFGSGKSDERTDLYNLGMTLFHLATGIHPAKAAHDEIDGYLRQSGISRELTSFIKALVRHDPSKRICDARTCLVMLDRMDGRQRQEKDAACSGLYAGRLTIGVAGVAHGIGATFTALCLAGFFASLGHKTAFADFCGNGDLGRLEEVLYKSDRLAHTDEESFAADGITYFRDGRTAVGRSARGFGRVLCDFGCLRDEKAIGEFNRSDVRLVMCPAADWKFALIGDFMARMSPHDPNREWIYVFPEFGKADRNLVRKTLQTNHVLFFPRVSNPYSQNRNEQKNNRAFFEEAMQMSGIERAFR